MFSSPVLHTDDTILPHGIDDQLTVKIFDTLEAATDIYSTSVYTAIPLTTLQVAIEANGDLLSCICRRIRRIYRKNNYGHSMFDIAQKYTLAYSL